MKKNLHLKRISLWFCLFAGLLLLGLPLRADAAPSYQRTGRTVKTGRYYIWGDFSSNTLRISRSKTGKGSLLAKPAKGRKIAYYALSNGSVVYYLEKKERGSNNTGYLYRIYTNKKGKQYLGKLANADWPVAYQNGNLYVDCHAKSDTALLHLYSLNTKTRKSKCVMKNFSPSIVSGNYLIGSPNSGSYVPLPLYSYHTTTGKKTLISKRSMGFAKVGNKLYYAELVNSQLRRTNTFRIRSCNLSGAGKKTLVKKLKGSSIGAISKKYVYYTKATSLGYWYYRYDLRTKKSKTVNFGDFRYR